MSSVRTFKQKLASVSRLWEARELARQLLTDGLIGEAKALLQLERKEEALRCLMEVLQLMQFHPRPKRQRSEPAMPDIVSRSSSGGVWVVEIKGPLTERVEELLNQLISSRSA